MKKSSCVLLRSGVDAHAFDLALEGVGDVGGRVEPNGRVELSMDDGRLGRLRDDLGLRAASLGRWKQGLIHFQISRKNVRYQHRNRHGKRWKY